MTVKRYQIFVSSTFRDLKEERAGVLELIQALDHIPAGMEWFPSGNDTPWEVIRRVIDTSDYYVLVIGGSYGSTREDGISYTESEYDYARSKSIPVMAFLHANPGDIPRDKSEMDAAAAERLDQFRKKIEDNHICTTWADAPDLKGKVAIALAHETTLHPRVGWIRGDRGDEIEDLLRQVNELQSESTILRTENEALRAQASLDDTSKFAQGDDYVELEFRVHQDEGSSKMTVSTKWKDVIEWLAPHLYGGKTVDEISGLLGTFASKRGPAADVNKIDQAAGDTLSIVRDQFVALRLIDVSSETIQQTIPPALMSRSTENRLVPVRREVWQLTSRGKLVIAQSRAIRSGS